MSALLCNADKLLLTALIDQIAKRRLVVLERAHLLQLLLDPAPTLQGKLQQLGQVFLRDLPVRMQDLHHPRDGAPHRLAVAGV